MLLPRSLHEYTTPPPPRNRIQDNPTLLVSWWCTSFALAIILVRLAGRFVRTERLFKEDKIMALSLIPLLARMALVHVVLIWGTNNTTSKGLTPLEVQRREIGSRLVLLSRIMYAMFLWIAKWTITEFLKRLTSHVWKRSYEIGLQIIRWFLIITFIGVVIATLAECQPFNNYWQVVPDPGANCRQGTAQLFTMGIADIITDLLIVSFPIPIVLKSAMTLQRKISLILLFALSLILVGITVYRMHGVTIRHSSQQFRSLLASLEILAAAAVSNALVLGSFVRDRGAKKQRFRFGSTGGHSSLDRSNTTPRRVMTMKNWGSDADLVGDLGMRLDPELTEKSYEGPRQAPAALPLDPQEDVNSRDSVNQNWNFPNNQATETKKTKVDSSKPSPVSHDHGSLAEVPSTPHGPSFFDVGGLLGDNDRSHVHSHHHSADIVQPGAAGSSGHQPDTTANGDMDVKRGSRAFLQDIGGLTPASPTRLATPKAADPRPEPSSHRSGLIEALKSTPPDAPADSSVPTQRQRSGAPGLQDVGGLLA